MIVKIKFLSLPRECFHKLFTPSCVLFQTHPRYLSCIATCCFHIAALTQESREHVFIPSPAELVKLSQCGGTDADLQRMENLIGEKLQWELDAITPLTFLQYFYEMFVLKEEEEVADPSVLNSLIAKLQVLMCQYRFAYYRVSCIMCCFSWFGFIALVSHYVWKAKSKWSSDYHRQMLRPSNEHFYLENCTSF